MYQHDNSTIRAINCLAEDCLESCIGHRNPSDLRLRVRQLSLSGVPHIELAKNYFEGAKVEAGCKREIALNNLFSCMVYNKDAINFVRYIKERCASCTEPLSLERQKALYDGLNATLVELTT